MTVRQLTLPVLLGSHLSCYFCWYGKNFKFGRQLGMPNRGKVSKCQVFPTRTYWRYWQINVENSLIDAFRPSSVKHKFRPKYA